MKTARIAFTCYLDEPMYDHLRITADANQASMQEFIREGLRLVLSLRCSCGKLKPRAGEECTWCGLRNRDAEFQTSDAGSGEPTT